MSEDDDSRAYARWWDEHSTILVVRSHVYFFELDVWPPQHARSLHVCPEVVARYGVVRGPDGEPVRIPGNQGYPIGYADAWSARPAPRMRVVVCQLFGVSDDDWTPADAVAPGDPPYGWVWLDEPNDLSSLPMDRPFVSSAPFLCNGCAQQGYVFHRFLRQDAEGDWLAGSLQLCKTCFAAYGLSLRAVTAEELRCRARLAEAEVGP